ncbi:TRAP transporter large permease [Paracoccus sp. SCSIO 75233]|uniref:TRAP transporter large permease n=1 Tax=Paracoccus sp. SCSIO 75233 TaxID=3017782 RepID=UPI0022F0B750|nr:TRAP transporter large permease [Paracoccus sp. SCSIO 75233]WBU53033.1 TRAP transporter large permease [Paracoccus sp. SCSIO 75233]
MGALVAILVVIILMFLGVPVVFSFAAMTLTLSLIYGIEISSLMTTGFWAVNSVILLALPLFIMTGYVLQSGGLARRLIDFVEALVGNSKSGMGASMIVACAIFGAISGTASAAVAAIGRIMVDPMERHGYDRGYVAALLGASSLLGLLIPPSITMILFAVVTRQSVTACFLATVGPGILLMILLIIYNAIRIRMGGELPEKTLPVADRWRNVGTAGWKAMPALMMPVIILGGIYGGFFTPTEAAAIALVYAIPVGMFVYRDLNLKGLFDCVVQAAATTGVIMVILVFSFISSRIFTMERIPQEMTGFLFDVFESPLAILIAVNLFLIALGMIMDDVSIIAITGPLLLPVMTEIGVEPVHFAAIIGMSVVIGCNTPPMAPILFLSCRVGNVGMSRVTKPALQLILFTALPVQIAVTFWPGLSLFLPRALGYL